MLAQGEPPPRPHPDGAGSGKTFTAIYRLIRHADARRVLFLVDRANLGRQTYNEFQQFTTPDDGRRFTEIYNVQQLQSNTIDLVSRVCIATIQRVYSILSGLATRNWSRGKARLDIFWLRDESLADAASLEDPDVIAADIIEDLQTALDEISLIYADLVGDEEPVIAADD